MEALADTLMDNEPASERSLAALIEDIRNGDECALEHLYETTVGKVYALAAAILRSVEDTEEVVCETYAYVWANAARYDTARGGVLGWLLTLCRSRAIDLLRRRKANATSVRMAHLGAEAAADERAEDLLMLLQQRTRVHDALSRLSPERRHLVALAFLQGLSHHEIAQATGLPLGTIKSHLRRSLAQLRGALEDL